MVTGCALDADGNLKNASDIEFFESETDTHPIGSRATHGELEKINQTGLCSSFTAISHFEIGLLSFKAGDLNMVPKVLKWLNTSCRNT